MKRRSKRRRVFFIIFRIVLPIFLLAVVSMLIARSCYVAGPTQASVIKLPNGHYQLLVNGKPYLVKGVCYQPIPIGKDFTYNWWGDPAKPWLLDGKLLKEAGANTVRFYMGGSKPQQVKQVLSDLYNKYGIRIIFGHPLGADDFPPPPYGDENYRAELKKEVLDMVKRYKEEPGIFLWLLGNENNLTFNDHSYAWGSYEIDKIEDPQEKTLRKAKVYYSFINEVAKEIHKIDPNHPVVMGNGEIFYLDIAKEAAPDVDILGGIFYRGSSFGNAWQQIETKFGKPVVLIEFGCDRYNVNTKMEDEEIQAEFLELQWKDIYRNTCDQNGRGNVLGGCVFEWNDEWWKHNRENAPSWVVHDEEGGWTNGAYYFDANNEGRNNMNEEWYGIVGLSPVKERGLNKRVPKKAYYTLKELWLKGCNDNTNSKQIKGIPRDNE